MSNVVANLGMGIIILLLLVTAALGIWSIVIHYQTHTEATQGDRVHVKCDVTGWDSNNLVVELNSDVKSIIEHGNHLKLVSHSVQSEPPSGNITVGHTGSLQVHVSNAPDTIVVPLDTAPSLAHDHFILCPTLDDIILFSVSTTSLLACWHYNLVHKVGTAIPLIEYVMLSEDAYFIRVDSESVVVFDGLEMILLECDLSSPQTTRVKQYSESDLGHAFGIDTSAVNVIGVPVALRNGDGGVIVAFVLAKEQEQQYCIVNLSSTMESWYTSLPQHRILPLTLTWKNTLIVMALEDRWGTFDITTGAMTMSPQGVHLPPISELKADLWYGIILGEKDVLQVGENGHIAWFRHLHHDIHKQLPFTFDDRTSAQLINGNSILLASPLQTCMLYDTFHTMILPSQSAIYAFENQITLASFEGSDLLLTQLQNRKFSGAITLEVDNDTTGQKQIQDNVKTTNMAYILEL